jgi:hypothetical protein
MYNSYGASRKTRTLLRGALKTARTSARSVQGKLRKS